MADTTFAEHQYQAAISALNGGDWQQAATHLLTLVGVAPQYRRVRSVLKTLEHARPDAYWRAAFDYALEQHGWDHAATALEMLHQVTPDAADLPALHTRLQAEVPAPPAPNGVSSAAPAALAVAEAVAPPDAADDADPMPLSVADILQLREFSEDDLRGIYAAADAAEAEAADQVSAAADLDDLPIVFAESLQPATVPLPDTLPEIDDRPLVLKTPLFATDTHREPGVSGGASAGPIYNALGEPLALKSAFLLEVEEMQPQAAEAVLEIPTRPADLTTPLAPETEFSTSPFEPADLDVSPPAALTFDSSLSFDDLQAIPFPITDEVVEDTAPDIVPFSEEALGEPLTWIGQGELAVEAEAAEAMAMDRLRRYTRRSRLLVVLAAVLLLAVLALAVVIGVQEDTGTLSTTLTPVSSPNDEAAADTLGLEDTAFIVQPSHNSRRF